MSINEQSGDNLIIEKDTGKSVSNIWLLIGQTVRSLSADATSEHFMSLAMNNEMKNEYQTTAGGETR